MALPEVWSDLDHRLITDGQGRLKKVSNIDAVRTSIDNILRTSVGERVMLPSFASRLKDLVFEPINDALAKIMADEVKRVVETWDDRVTIAGVDFNTDPDRNFVSLTIRFVVRGYSETYTHTVNLTAE
jgi:phage baseplate assembly protein W